MARVVPWVKVLARTGASSLADLDVSPPVDRFYFRTYEGSAYMYIYNIYI